MTTYALIHGAHHGAWCWDFLVPELAARGHRGIAMDLPTEDTKAGVSKYAEVVVDALAEVRDEVVLVGHSLGGVIAPVVATLRPVHHLVYLAAWIPEPGRTLADQQLDEPDAGFGSSKVDNGDGTWSRPADEAARVYYHDCTPDRREYAIARLRRQSRAPNEEPSPLADLPDAPATYIMCAHDRAVRPDWQRRTARRRLGAEPLEIPTSHAPFLARPADLADMLVGLSPS